MFGYYELDSTLFVAVNIINLRDSFGEKGGKKEEKFCQPVLAGSLLI